MFLSKHHCFCITKTEEPILTFDKSQKICQRTGKILVRLDSLLFVEISYHTVMTSTSSSVETPSNNSKFYKINSCIIDILQYIVCGAFNHFPKCRIKNYQNYQELTRATKGFLTSLHAIVTSKNDPITAHSRILPRTRQEWMTNFSFHIVGYYLMTYSFLCLLG